jgi:hypothetical protein
MFSFCAGFPIFLRQRGQRNREIGYDWPLAKKGGKEEKLIMTAPCKKKRKDRNYACSSACVSVTTSTSLKLRETADGTFF